MKEGGKGIPSQAAPAIVLTWRRTMHACCFRIRKLAANFVGERLICDGDAKQEISLHRVRRTRARLPQSCGAKLPLPLTLTRGAAAAAAAK